jgi:hypothetical protein
MRDIVTTDIEETTDRQARQVRRSADAHAAVLRLLIAREQRRIDGGRLDNWRPIGRLVFDRAGDRNDPATATCLGERKVIS